MSDDEYALFDEFHWADIEYITKNNNNFREVIATTPNMQLVLMSLKPHEDIGIEIHPYTTQFIRIESGDGEAIIEGKQIKLHDGIAVIIPLNSKHNIINLSNKNSLKLYTIYSPPHHPYDRVDKNKPL